MFRTALIFVIFNLLQDAITGQSIQPDIPYSYQYNLNPLNSFVIMPAINPDALKSEDLQRDVYGFKRKRFAKGFDTDYCPFNSGEWQSVPNGGRAWRLGIKSTGAYSLYLVFGKFHLKKGITLFIYNKTYSELNGPITYLKNNTNNILPVAPIPGDEVIAELDVPPGMEFTGDISITKVWHDYANEFGTSRLKSEKSSSAGACNIDINCPLGAAWQSEKQAVCRLIVNGEYCTGTMINNIRGEKIPYLLTAYHCVEDSSIAASALVYFDYEKPYCNALSNTGYKTMEGATLVATTPNQLDFSLLRLNGFPPLTYRAYLAGWETDPANPANYSIIGVTCIHHPAGDVKKISTAMDTLVTSDFGDGYNYNSHWLIKTWENGVTERGSSGAAIFNNNHRIVGTLTGGDSKCGSPINDYFSKFLLAWDYYPEKKKQLKAWLDPDNTGITYVNGTDPYGFNDLNCDTITNIKTSESVVLEKNNLVGGYISGHNTQQWQSFAEKFHTTDTTQIAEILFHVAKAKYGGVLSYIYLKVWTGINAPDTQVYSKLLYIKNINPSTVNYLRLDTVLQLKGNFYIGYSINYPSPADTFALYYAAKRSDNTSTMYIRENTSWYNIKDVSGIEYPTSLDIGYIGCENLDLKLKTPLIQTTKSLNFYPNPCNTYIITKIPNSQDKLTIQCFDIHGKILPIHYKINNNEVYFDVSYLKPGIYWMGILTRTEKYSGKFVVVR
jgi:lysyl endopeptidase